MFDKLQASQITKAVIFFAICFTLALIILNSGEDDQPKKSENLESPRMAVPGGLGADRGSDDEVVGVVAKIKPIFEEKTNTKYESIDVISYKHQVVAGKNYFVKAKAKAVGGDEKIVHLRIYRKLNQDVELTAFELDKTLEEEVKYFQ